jgi:basic membrane protein A
MNLNKKIMLFVLLSLLVGTVSAGGLVLAQEDTFKGCQITDTGGIDDKSFNQTAWAGMERAAEELGVEVQFLESQQQTDYARNIDAMIEDECDLIITVGFLLGEDTATAAAANPDSNFAIVDFAYDPPIDNVLGLVYSTDQAAFLAGYVAAAATETGIVGTFGGINIPTVTIFMDGFALGVQYYNETNDADVQVLGWDVEAHDGLFTGNFESTDDGRAFGESLMDEGADIIMPVAGPVGLGTAAAVQERGDAWLIGVDTDWTQSAPDFADIILTSVLKRMDNSVFNVIELAMNGEFVGGVFVSDLENEGVGIAEVAEGAVSDEVLEVLPELMQAIIDGEIETSPPPAVEATEEA